MKLAYSCFIILYELNGQFHESMKKGGSDTIIPANFFCLNSFKIWIRFFKLKQSLLLKLLGFCHVLQPFPSMSVWSQNDAIKSCSIYKKDKNGCFILDFFGSDLSKMDQTWSNLIKLDFSQIKKCFYKKFSHLQRG